MFTKYFTQLDLQGHECERRVEFDELLLMIPGDNVSSRIYRWIWKKCVISETNYRSYKYLRSKSAINYERSRHIRQYPWMIHPLSDFRASYEIFMMVIFITTLFARPLVTLFDNHPEASPSVFASVLLYFILITDIICLLCVVINFRTGHLSQDNCEVYLSPKLAARHYLQGFFLIDIITSIPLHFVSYQTPSALPGKIVDVLCIVRLLRYFPLKRFYENTVEVYGMEFMKSRLIRLSFLAVLFLHWGACIHYLTAKVVQSSNCETISSESWIKLKCQKNMSNSLSLYLESLFRSCTNTFNMGYAHSWPTTNEDMLITMFICIWGNCLVFYAIVTIMLLINTKHSSTTKYLKMTLQLRGYMHHKNITAAMQHRIMSYYDYRFLRNYYQEEEILSSITSQLKQCVTMEGNALSWILRNVLRYTQDHYLDYQSLLALESTGRHCKTSGFDKFFVHWLENAEITMHSCRRLVENVSFFQNIPMSMMIRIVSHMRSEWFLSNDVIIAVGSVGDSMYFIKSGTVAIYTANGKEVCHLEDGAHFGEISLVMPQDRRIANVIAVENCLLYRLDKEDFRRAVAPFPDLFARIQSIAKERLNRTQEISKTKSAARVRMKLKLGPPQRLDNRLSTFRNSAL